jgi:hypothetical protein
MTVAFCAKFIHDEKSPVLISLIAITKLGSDFFVVKFFYDYILIRAIGIVLLLLDVLCVIITLQLSKKKIVRKKGTKSDALQEQNEEQQPCTNTRKN